MYVPLGRPFRIVSLVPEVQEIFVPSFVISVTPSPAVHVRPLTLKFSPPSLILLSSSFAPGSSSAPPVALLLIPTSVEESSLASSNMVTMTLPFAS